jgi:hypothetical protein
MYDNPIIDVSIGLALIYCIYSLFTTIINEFIASIFNLRAQMLKRAIKRMLTDSKKTNLGNELLNDFYNHPLIKYMSSGIIYKLPSYISEKNFSKALLDTLKGFNDLTTDESTEKIRNKIKELDKKNDNNRDSETLMLINSFLSDAKNDLDLFREELERWFNDTMDRVTGWYKRQAQLIIFFIGFGTALGFNVNTFEIISYLSKDKVAREHLVNIAENYVKDRQDAVSDTNTAKRLDSLVIAAHEMYKTDIEPVNKVVFAGWRSWDDFTKRFFDSFLGCLVTALAISLGAPFWFDLLNKLINIRGTGKKPSEDKTGDTKISKMNKS